MAGITIACCIEADTGQGNATADSSANFSIVFPDAAGEHDHLDTPQHTTLIAASCLAVE